MAAPQAPTNLRPSEIRDTRAEVVWEDNATNEDGYRVYISTDGGKNWKKVAQLSPGSTRYIITNLQDSTRYFVKVSAYNTDGTSIDESSTTLSDDTEDITITSPTVTIDETAIEGRLITQTE